MTDPLSESRLAEIRERDAEYTDELLDGWRKLFERHAMKCDRAIVDRHDLLDEVDRLTRELAEAQGKVAWVDALANDCAAQDPTELAPVRGMATLIRAALSGGAS